jgi:hypothetical protein
LASSPAPRFADPSATPVSRCLPHLARVAVRSFARARPPPGSVAPLVSASAARPRASPPSLCPSGPTRQRPFSHPPVRSLTGRPHRSASSLPPRRACGTTKP